MLQPVVFLDKDGTLIKDVPYNVDPERITLENESARGLSLLAKAGFRFVVVSNQSGVARGYFHEAALDGVRARLEELLQAEAGVSLAGFYYCPHHPEGSVAEYAVACSCRKPEPGMLLTAAKEMNIQLSEAWLIGDILNDIEAGNRAGCRTILLNNGHETEWEEGPFREPDFLAKDLVEAAYTILANSSPQANPTPGSRSTSSE